MAAGNHALDTNPPSSAISINTHGSDWLWAVFAVFLLTDLLVVAWTWTRARGTRAFHILAIAILTTGVVAYYSMASDLGSTPVVAEYYGMRHQNYAGVPATRAIWFVRYILWTIAAPLLVLEVLLTSGLPVSDVFGACFMSVVAVVSGLVGALTATSYKWGYYAFAIAAMLYVVHVFMVPGRTSAGFVGHDIGTLHTRGAGYLSFLWLIYPIAWGLSEGGNVISSNGEMVFYGILDLLTMPVFLLLHLFQLRTIDHSRFGMNGTGVGGVGGQYGQYGEKGNAGRGAPLGGVAGVGAGGAGGNAVGNTTAGPMV